MHFGKNNRFIALAVAIFLVALPAFSEASDSSGAWKGTLKSAFRAGLKSDAPAPILRIGLYGNSTRLTAAGDGESEMTLMCLLCTPEEMLSSARALGALWTGRDGRDSKPASVSFSESVGNRVWLDGVPVAPLESRHPVAVGNSTVVAKRGPVDAYGNLDVRRDSGNVDISLKSLQPERADRRIPAGVLLTGLAWSTAAASGILFAVDGDTFDEGGRPAAADTKIAAITTAVIAAVLQLTAGGLFGSAAYAARKGAAR